jgi:hypothetical protein
MLMELQKEREKMELEEVAAQEAAYMKLHTRTCPECDRMNFIPEDDYICEGCRNKSLIE